jgi:hypothetical protein
VQSRLLTAYVDSAASDCSPGTFMKVVRYTPGSFVFDDLMSQDLGASPTQLQLVPRGEGAWLVWQIDDGVTSGPLEAMKLDSDGLPEGGVISLVQSGAVFEKVALAALGDGLALAYTDSFDPSTPTIVVEVFDADGVQTAATSLTPVAWPRVGEGYGLVGSPSADALLLSWASAEVDPNVEGSARVFTARLDCSRGDPSL